MADLEIRIRGARGSGKTTLAKHLFNLLANSPYYVEEVEGSNALSTAYIRDVKRPLAPIIRAPRSVAIELVEVVFDADIDVLEDDDD